MRKKIILDVDPGVVDAIVLALALFSPDVDVVAVTSVGGNVPADISAKNLQAINEYLDPPRLPRIGFGSPPDDGLPCDARHVHGIDGLCGANLPVAELRSQHPAEKVICDVVRANPDQISLFALGPLTNIARAFARDPELPPLLENLIICGGAINGPGNISPVAEFNFFADPVAAKNVIKAPCHTKIVPLDVTNRILFTLTHLNNLPSEETKLGALTRGIILPAFRAYRQCYGLEGIHIHEVVAFIAALFPDLTLSKSLPVDVETEGILTRGMTVFDQRPQPSIRNSVDVVFRLDDEAIVDRLIQGLHFSSDRMEENIT